MSKRKDVLILRTYEVHWLNHPKYALSMQYVAEDLMFDSIATSRKSFSTVDDLGYDETYLYNELDLAIEIQEAIIKNIESVTHPNDNEARFFYEDGMPDYNDTMDYKKIETILNRRRLSIGF